jgi:putative ABC transport system ATP-binding protein
MIELQSVSKTYIQDGKQIQALDRVYLRVEQGEFVSVIGPSGSGKSTFLLTVGGLIKPTTGEVWINGTSIYRVDHRKRAGFRLQTLGFMFQTFNLIPYLTAHENVEVPMALAGLRRRDQESKASRLLERVGLGHRARHRPAQLSVGERQRVALARTLANDPSIILADEPTGNLDPEMSVNVISYFREFAADGITVLLVTHDHQKTSQSDRKISIIDGVVTELCSPAKEEEHVS